MNLAFLKGFKDSRELAGDLKSLLSSGGHFTESSAQVIDSLQDSLFVAIRSGDEQSIDQWIKKAADTATSAADRAFLTGNTFKNTIKELAQRQIFNNKFNAAFVTGNDIDLAALGKKYNIDADSLSAYKDMIDVRESQIARKAAMSAAAHGGDSADYMDSARKAWAAFVQDGMPKADISIQQEAAPVRATPKPRLVLAVSDGKATGRYTEPAEQSIEKTTKTQVSEAKPVSEASPVRTDAAKPVSEDFPARTDTVKPPTGDKATPFANSDVDYFYGRGGGTTPPGGGTTPPGAGATPRRAGTHINLPAADLSKDIPYNKEHQQGIFTRIYSHVRRDGSVPYGEYDEARTKKMLESGEYDTFVLPKNKMHFQHIKFIFKNLPAEWDVFTRKVSDFFNSDKEGKLAVHYPHENLPNIFADTLYARPLIKAVDARMKASGLSGAVYDMQVKMRAFNEVFAHDPLMTAEKYKAGMRKIYDDFVSQDGIDDKANKFVESLDPILKELRARLYSAQTPIPGYSKKRIAFEYEGPGKAITGLTQDQVRNMIEYYEDIQDTARRIADPESGFLDKYMNEIDREILSSHDRKKYSDLMKTMLIGYHNDDGMAGYSRLGRMGSEVEARLSGYNVFKLDLGKSKPGKPVFEKARYDQNAQLERSFDNEVASTHDRKLTIQSRGGRSNSEAVYFMLDHQFEVYDYKWGVDRGNDFARDSESMIKYGYEDQYAQLIRHLRWQIGADTSLKTMPIGQMDMYAKTSPLLEQARLLGDEHILDVSRKVRDKADKIPQSPDPAFFRTNAKIWLNQTGRDLHVDTAFPDGATLTPPFPARGLLSRMLSPIDDILGLKKGKGLSDRLDNMFNMNVTMSAPLKYKLLTLAKNDFLSRPIAYLTGGKTKILKPRDDYKDMARADKPNPFQPESVDWKSYVDPVVGLYTGPRAFIQSYKDAETGGIKNIGKHWSAMEEKLPFYVRATLRGAQGGLPLLFDTKKAGIAGTALAWAIWGGVGMHATAHYVGNDAPNAEKQFLYDVSAPMRYGSSIIPYYVGAGAHAVNLFGGGIYYVARAGSNVLFTDGTKDTKWVNTPFYDWGNASIKGAHNFSVGLDDALTPKMVASEKQGSKEEEKANPKPTIANPYAPGTPDSFAPQFTKSASGSDNSPVAPALPGLSTTFKTTSNNITPDSTISLAAAYNNGDNAQLNSVSFNNASINLKTSLNGNILSTASGLKDLQSPRRTLAPT